MIERERDWVRWEIEQAFDRARSQVIPVLLKTGTEDPVVPANAQTARVDP